MFDNFWSILDVLGSRTVVGGLKVIWRSPMVISRSFEVILYDFQAFIYTYMGLNFLYYEYIFMIDSQSGLI